MRVSDSSNQFRDFAQHAVDQAVSFSRALWYLAFTTEGALSDESGRPGEWTILKKDQVQQILSEYGPDFLKILSEKRLYGVLQDNRVWFHADVYHPIVFVLRLLEGIRLDHELRYFAMRNIRFHYEITLSYDLVHLFNLLAKAANNLRAKRAADDNHKTSRYWKYQDEICRPLELAITSSLQEPLDATKVVELFVETCRAVGYIKASYNHARVDFRTTVDAEFLLANLFGLQTDIPGFDELFGGGLLLPDSLDTNIPSSLSSRTLPGRTILVNGRFGTGKTLLALKLAVEVARKGGLSWVMPLEQSAEECLYALESIGASPYNSSVIVAADVLAAERALRGERNGRGVLIILKTIKHSYDSFLTAVKDNAERMQGYHLRLIVADPINSVVRSGAGDESQLRARMLETIEQITRSGINVLLVREEESDPEKQTFFEQNIADTVIRLSIDQRYGYAQRHFEIMKSRFQREQPGQHAFAIKAGRGITIFPSSDAVMSRILQRRPPQLDRRVRSVIPLIDDTLRVEMGSVMIGDVLAMQGPEGSFKTIFGLLFLLGSDKPPGYNERRRVSLLVAARDDESSIKFMLSQPWLRKSKFSDKTIEDIRICSLPRGYVEPGFILQSIEDEFHTARRENTQIDRVMVDDVAHWEMSCPIVQADLTFGDTLVELLRRRHVTSLFLCNEIPPGRPSPIQGPIIDNADCAILLERYVFRDVPRVMFQILKTRGMQHQRDSFEVVFNRQGLQIRPSSSLLRFGSGGEVRAVPIRLFLHSENIMQDKYNKLFLDSVRSTLSPETELEAQERIDIEKIMQLGVASAVDELQVLQLDEFQLPHLTDPSTKSSPLFVFSNKFWDTREWQDFLPGLEERVRISSKDFFAVPLYENFSFLAYRNDLIDRVETLSWERLANASDHWCREHNGSDHIFFDFPRGSPENYNCLFLEILFSFDAPKIGQHYQLIDWLRRPIAVETGLLLRRLCRPAYLARGGNDLDMYRNRRLSSRRRASRPVPDLPSYRSNITFEGANIDVTVDSQAVVWRHWYTTLNEMISTLERSQRHLITVSPLPGGVAIAGEWYVGMPTYSAAPSIGLEIIKLMTSKEAELDRLRMGVGLPTRKSYYQPSKVDNVINTSISPYFSMEANAIQSLVTNAVRRSDFDGYAKLSKTMARAIQRIIEIEDQHLHKEREIRSILDDLEKGIQFLHLD